MRNKKTSTRQPRHTGEREIKNQEKEHDANARKKNKKRETNLTRLITIWKRTVAMLAVSWGS